MLSWSGACDLPQVPFGRLFRRLDRPVPAGAEIVTAFTDGQVTLRSNRPKTGYHEAADLSKFKGVSAGDFVVHGLDILRGSVGISDSSGAISAVCTVCEPIVELDARYIAHAIRVQARTGFTRALARGIREGGADFRRWGTLAELPIPMPSFEYQRMVCDYLDRETARIDALIEEQQRLIETLRERRRVVLIEATCRGISASATLKPSGVDWMGEIPSHWQAIAIKWLTPVRRGASPRPIQDPVYFDDDGEWAWVRIADVSSAGSGGVLIETTQTLSALGSSLSVKINPGELFVSIAGTVGKPCIAGIKCCIHDGFVYFPELDIDPWWLFRVFEAGECYGGLGKLGTQLNLNTDTIGGIQVPIPPPDEMAMVLAYIEAQTAKIDELIAESERFIELSRERRAALITAAVTGQIDVREVA